MLPCALSKSIFKYLFLILCMWGWNICVRGQMHDVRSPGLQLHVSYPIWALGTKLRSPTSAVCAFGHWAISPGPELSKTNKYNFTIFLMTFSPQLSKRLRESRESMICIKLHSQRVESVDSDLESKSASLSTVSRKRMSLHHDSSPSVQSGPCQN